MKFASVGIVSRTTDARLWSTVRGEGADTQ
jgi:hypothetical protein